LGQTQDVLAWFTVLQGSIESRMARVCAEKQDVIAAAIDDDDDGDGWRKDGTRGGYEWDDDECEERKTFRDPFEYVDTHI
jgi:hypothetical protein